MKLYNSVGPNPRMVRMFMAEKGFDVPKVEVDLRGGENRREPYAQGQSGGPVPGAGARRRHGAGRDHGDLRVRRREEEGHAVADRRHARGARQDPHVDAPHRPQHRRAGANGFRFSQGLKLFENRVRCIPEAADGLKATAQDKLKWLDGLMGAKPFIAGDKLTMADILLFAFVDFMGQVGQPLSADCKNLTAWYGRMKARPSAAA